MKKILILLLLFVADTILAQKTIPMSWHFNISDYTIKSKKDTYFGLPWTIFETKNNDLVLVSQQFFGWTIEKIDKNNGNIIWKNARNQDYPDSTQKMFIVDNIFERKDGNLEILGTKTKAKYFTPFFDGIPIRSIYDLQNGNEINYTEPPFDLLKQNYPMTWGGVSRRFIQNKDNYLVASSLSSSAQPTFTLRTLDTTMIIKDTLGKFVSPFANNKAMKFQGGSHPHDNGNNLSFIQYYNAGVSDTTLNAAMFTSISKKGKVNFVKNISKELYYRVNLFGFVSSQEGIFATGLVDTNNVLKKAKMNVGFAALIDTLGNKKWEVLLTHPNNKIFEIVTVCEDPKRNGYWAFAGHSDEGTPYLYFISKTGKAKLVCKVNIPNNNEKFFPSKIAALKDGSLILSTRYQKCDKDPTFVYCWGIGKVESSYLDGILSSTNEELKDENSDITIYPNPAKDNFTVILAQTQSESGSLCIFDNNGKMITNQLFFETNSINIDTRDILSGLYIVKITLNNRKPFFKKIVIQN